MNDLVGMHVMTCLKDLNQVETSLRFAKPPMKHIHERARLTELKSHVDIVIVFRNNLGSEQYIGMFD